MIWFTRIFGTLGIGREAMGLGDVHLLAAIGATIGWKAAIIVFFVAPFFGLTYAIIGMGISQVMKKRMTPIPYGPHLAIAAVVVMYAWEPIMRHFDKLVQPL